MPKCVIKVCRNYQGRLRTTHKVTYHRIPFDPLIRIRWVDVIRRSRGEDCWQPAKTTIICSDHFREKDWYSLPFQKRRRLKKEAVPTQCVIDNHGAEIRKEVPIGILHMKDTKTTRVFLSSLKADSEISDEDGPPGKEIVKLPEQSCEQSSRGPGKNKESPVKEFTTFPEESCESEESDIIFNMEQEQPVMISLASAEDSLQPNQCSDPLTSVKTEVDSNDGFSDLDSVFDSPVEEKLRNQLRRKMAFEKKHILKIQSLRRKNIRLNKKVASLKEALKKEKDICPHCHKKKS